MRLILLGIALALVLVLILYPESGSRLLGWWEDARVPAGTDAPASGPSLRVPEAAYPTAQRTIEAATADVYVVDADTLRVGPVRVRLDGIAAPEAEHEQYEAGRRFLSELIRSGSLLRCGLTGVRSYRREIGYCLLTTRAREVDIQAAVVAAGLARDCPRYSAGRYRRFETDAARALPLPGYCRPR